MPKTSQVAFDLANIARPLYFPYRAYHNVKGWEKLVSEGPKLTLSSGFAIHSSTSPNYGYLVTSGVIGAHVRRADGSQSQTAFFLEGSMFLEPSALSQLPSNLLYQALTAAEVVRIDHDDLKAAMMRDPDVLDFVVTSITLKLNAAHEQLYETMNLDVRARIYFMLLGLAKDSGTMDDDGWIRLGFKLTQQEMSDMLGINRVTANTALQDLYDVGVVKKAAGYYLVRDTEGFTKTTL